MRDRQANQPAAVRLDIECDTRMFRIVSGVLWSRPCDHQATWRNILDDRTDNVDRARIVDARSLGRRVQGDALGAKHYLKTWLVVTASGSRVSGNLWKRSSSQAKTLTNGQRCRMT